MASLNFNALRELHNSANDLLNSRIVQQSLNHQKQVEEVSEASLTMLDVCSISKNVLSLVREHLQDLKFTLRSGDFDVRTKITAYDRYRKTLRKETLKCLESLKGMVKKDKSIPTLDRNLLVVVEVLKEIRLMALSAVESLMYVVSVPWLDRRSSRGSLSCMFARSHAKDSCDFFDECAVGSASARLEAAEIAVEELEVELDCVFRRLIETRVLLLNILTS